ncbi:MAG: DUF6506 family protein [Anaerovoracaceae bacterium]
MFECCFIYVSPGLDPAVNRAVIPSTDINMTVVGCSNYTQAELVCKEMVIKGCTAVELCAGFGVEGVERMKKAAGPGVAVGAIRFDFHPAFEFKSGDDIFK